MQDANPGVSGVVATCGATKEQGVMRARVRKSTVPEALRAEKHADVTGWEGTCQAIILRELSVKFASAVRAQLCITKMDSNTNRVRTTLRVVVMLDSHSGASCMHDVRVDMLAKSVNAQNHRKATRNIKSIRSATLRVAAKSVMGICA